MPRTDQERADRLVALQEAQTAQIANTDRMIRATALRRCEAEERRRQEREASAPSAPSPQPVTRDDRSQNPLRPWTFDEVIGQAKVVSMMRRLVAASKASGDPLDHVLMTGPAGTGKTTFANVIAHELDVACYQVSAPVSLDTLLALRETLNDGDVFFIDEIHLQAIQERRGKESVTQPEVFLQLLEDRVIATERGMLPFPAITVIGATTDPGRLPEPFLDRFPLRPRLAPYTDEDLTTIALHNAPALRREIEPTAAAMFAEAARGTPRLVNNYVRNGSSLATSLLTVDVAREVIEDLNDTTPDGLNRYMRDLLTFLYSRGRREKANGEVVYQASVSTLATAVGLSRDTKAIVLHVEPYLLERGLLQIGSGGRLLTDQGVERARELLEDTNGSN